MPRSAQRFVLPVTIIAFALAIGAAVLMRMPAPRKRVDAMMLTSHEGPVKLVGRRVLIAPFRNDTGDPSLDALGVALAGWVAKGISQSTAVDVVSPLLLQSILAKVDSLPWPGRRWDRALALADETGAGVVVRGRLAGGKDQTIVDADLVNANTGRIIRSVATVRLPSFNPLAAADSLRRQIVRALPKRVVFADSDSVALRPLPVPKLEAYEAYIGGIEMLGKGRPASLKLFLRAANMDTSFVLALVLAGGAAIDFEGGPVLADSLLDAAALRRDALVPYDALLLDRLRALRRGEYARALEISRQMTKFAPASHAPFFLALDAAHQNRPRETLEALRLVGSERGLLRGQSRYWYDVAWSHHQLGEHEEELKVATEGLALYPLDMTLIDAKVRALSALGRAQEVGRWVDSARATRAMGSLTWRRVALDGAEELRAHGHPAEAQTLAERVVAYYRQRPSGSDEEMTRHAHGHALDVARQYAAAESVYRALVVEHPEDWQTWGDLGVVLARLGKRGEARSVAAKLAKLDTAQTKPELGTVELRRARIAAQLGDRAEAIALLREAFARGLGHRYYWLHADADFEPLRGEPAFDEMARPKG